MNGKRERERKVVYWWVMWKIPNDVSMPKIGSHKKNRIPAKKRIRFGFNCKSICSSDFFTIPWITIYDTISCCLWPLLLLFFNKRKIYFQNISLAASIYCFKTNTIKRKKMNLMDFSQWKNEKCCIHSAST